MGPKDTAITGRGSPNEGSSFCGSHVFGGFRFRLRGLVCVRWACSTSHGCWETSYIFAYLWLQWLKSNRLTAKILRIFGSPSPASTTLPAGPRRLPPAGAGLPRATRAGNRARLRFAELHLAERRRAQPCHRAHRATGAGQPLVQNASCGSLVGCGSVVGWHFLYIEIGNKLANRVMIKPLKKGHIRDRTGGTLSLTTPINLPVYYSSLRSEHGHPHLSTLLGLVPLTSNRSEGCDARNHA